MLNHKGSQQLETHRLIIRKFTKNDAQDMFDNWASDDDVTQHLSWPSHPDINMSKKVLDMWIEEYKNLKSYQWAIEVKDTSKVIGSISLLNINNKLEKCEIGYCIGKEFWNQGIVTEAFRAIIKFAIKEIGFNRITGRHHTGNKASGRVMEKCGLQYEGHLRQILKNKHGEFVDCKYYSILKDEYFT